MAEETGVPQLWKDFISADPLFQELSELKAKGWANPAADTFFEKRRKEASCPDWKMKKGFYKMTQQIGEELVSATKVLNLDSDNLRVLDLCMAPGGFSATVKRMVPESHIDAITLPLKAGGYEVMARNVCQEIIFGDVTMFLSEICMDDEIPKRRPDLENFERGQPYLGHKYDLIFCGGAVVKTQPREDYRNISEGRRLTLSQLVLALNRLKHGGSLVLLLHRVESLETARMLYVFNKFADIQLFKPPKTHGIKSSFYLVAKNVNLKHDIAEQAVSYWKALWKFLIFSEFTDLQPPSSKLLGDDTITFVQELVDKFGTQFLKLAHPLWKIQRDNLQRAQFMKSN